MHLIAHGIAALLTAASDGPWRTVGTWLPDLQRKPPAGRWPQVMRGFQATDERAAACAAGVRQHLAGDAVFHATDAFEAHCRALTDALRAAAGTASRAEPTDARPRGVRRTFRASVLAHIAVELLIDMHLLARRPDAAAALDALITAVGPAALSADAAAWFGTGPALRTHWQALGTHRPWHRWHTTAGVSAHLAWLSPRLKLGQVPPTFDAVITAAAPRVERDLPALLAGTSAAAAL